MTHASLFVGGGTGGHLYPALAIIEQIHAARPNALARIACSTRDIDRRVLATAGVPFTPIPARSPGPTPARLARFAAAWRTSVQDLRAMIRDMRAQTGPVVVVAMGGFVSAPALRAARRERVPIALVNLDAVPGRANRYLARRVDAVYTAAPVEGRPSWTRTPPIVRAAMNDPIEPSQARRSLDLDPDTRTLLITGGSQGARSINTLMTAFARAHPDALTGWQILHQCGPGADRSGLDNAYQSLGVAARVVEYIDDMRPALYAADLTLSRCGAGSVAECAATRTPALFLPYPYHKDEHQRHNARVLTDTGAAIVRTDRVDPDANLADAGAQLRRLLTDPAALAAARSAADALPPADGAARVARALERLAGAPD